MQMLALFLFFGRFEKQYSLGIAIPNEFEK